MHTKLERLLSKSLTTMEVMAYYLVVHTGPAEHWGGLGRELDMKFATFLVNLLLLVA